MFDDQIPVTPRSLKAMRPICRKAIYAAYDDMETDSESSSESTSEEEVEMVMLTIPNDPRVFNFARDGDRLQCYKCFESVDLNTESLQMHFKTCFDIDPPPQDFELVQMKSADTL